MKKPPFALAIRQPWASLIIHGGKDIENRDWYTEYRGPVFIHASKLLRTGEVCSAEDLIRGNDIVLPKTITPYLANDGLTFNPGILLLGGIIGMVDIIDCVTTSPSRWFTGPYGFVLANPRPLPFHPVRGLLKFFKVEYPWAEVPV